LIDNSIFDFNLDIGWIAILLPSTLAKGRRKGEERKGEERKGEERRGEERKGKERKGKVLILLALCRRLSSFWILVFI
jgi:hypothetical protein